MKRLAYLFFIVFSFTWSSSSAQSFNKASSSITYTNEDMAVFNRYLHAMEGKKDVAFDQLIIETALFFSNTPYVASTLESEKEHLIINLRELDCTTFVENVVALAYTVKDDSSSFDRFCDYLRMLRYRNGRISGYTDRLHYFSDWIYENEQAGFVRDVTKQIGGRSHPFNLSFISAHPESYPALKAHPEYIEIMKDKEQEISARNIYTMIPKAEINNMLQGMKDGDIVCFVTKIGGLDITHVGFVYWQDQTLKLVHASSAAKKVIVDLRPLHQYAENVKSTIGVMIIRPQQAVF